MLGDPIGAQDPEEDDASEGRELIRLLLTSAASGASADWTQTMLDGLSELLPWTRLPPSPLELLELLEGGPPA